PGRCRHPLAGRPGARGMSAELAARATAAETVLADFRADFASAPLTSPPPMTTWALRLSGALNDLLAGLSRAAPDTASLDAGRLAAIRGVLDAFDWEHDDRQYALERIEEIAEAPAAIRLGEDGWAARSCPPAEPQPPRRSRTSTSASMITFTASVRSRPGTTGL